jgi:hypothetical protein
MFKKIDDKTEKLCFWEVGELELVSENIENLLLQEMILTNLDFLSKFKKIKKLMLWNCDVQNLQSIQQLKSLEFLELGTGNDVIALDNLKVKEIRLHRSANTKELYLSNCPNLEKLLILDNTKIISLLNLPKLSLVASKESNKIEQFTCTNVFADCEFVLYNFEGLVRQ